MFPVDLDFVQHPQVGLEERLLFLMMEKRGVLQEEGSYERLC